MTSLIKINNEEYPSQIWKQRSSFSGGVSRKSNLIYILRSPSGYHSLPASVLANIFQYFNESELCKNISLVCRQWRYVAQQPQLWKKLYFNGSDVPTHFICQKVRDLSNVQFIYLENIAEPVTVIRQICRWIPHIKYLGLRNCPPIPEITLRNLIQCCRSLEGLDLNGTEFKANRFFEEIAGLTSLKSINISRNTELNICNIISTVLNCRQLEELKLSIFCPSNLEQLRDQDASLIIKSLASTIKSLTLDTGGLSECSFKAIMNCNKLEKLGLYRAINLSSDLFTNLWKSLPNLQVLKVRQAPYITGPNVAELFKLGNLIMQNLTVIDFTDCWKVRRPCHFLKLRPVFGNLCLEKLDGITDIGMEGVANCCKNLKALTLRGCKSIVSLEVIRQKCKKLEKLNIAFCTNLNLQTITPLPEHIKTIILDKSDKFAKLLENILLEKKIFNIKVCLSEFNQQIQNIKN